MKQLPRIYCDMDGVLCDFKKHAEKVTGVSIAKWSTLSKAEKWGPIKEDRYFWSTMPWMAGGKQLWNFISMYKPHILSAYVEESFDPNCIPGKTKWLKTNVQVPTDRINLVRRVQKQNFADHRHQQERCYHRHHPLSCHPDGQKQLINQNYLFHSLYRHLLR